MAGPVLRTKEYSGQTLTALPVRMDTDADVGTARTGTEKTNALSVYTFAAMAAAPPVTGLYAVKVYAASDLIRTYYAWLLTADDENVTVDLYDSPLEAYLSRYTTGTLLTAIPWNAAWDAEVQSECADALVAYDPPTNAEMEARTIAAASYATASGVSAVETDTQDIQSRLPAALVSGRIDANTQAMADGVVTAAKLASDCITAGKIADDAITSGKIAANAIGASELAADAVAEIQSGLSTHAAADVWAVATRVLTAGTNIVLAKGTGVTGFTDLSAAQVNAECDTAIADAALATAANLATVAGYLDTEIAAILADTNELQTDWADGGRLDVILDARAAQTTLAALVTTVGVAGAGLTAADDAVIAAIAALSIPTANANADALLDRASAVDGKTVRETLRIVASTTAGEVSGAGTSTEVFKGLDGSTTRVTVTADSDGNRTEVTYG